MNEKQPSAKQIQLGGYLSLMVSILLVLVRSDYSSEWWSVAIWIVALFFFIAAVAHVFVYSVLADYLRK